MKDVPYGSGFARLFYFVHNERLYILTMRKLFVIARNGELAHVYRFDRDLPNSRWGFIATLYVGGSVYAVDKQLRLIKYVIPAEIVASEDCLKDGIVIGDMKLPEDINKIDTRTYTLHHLGGECFVILFYHRNIEVNHSYIMDNTGGAVVFHCYKALTSKFYSKR